jgi:hypothetical protein
MEGIFIVVEDVLNDFTWLVLRMCTSPIPRLSPLCGRRNLSELQFDGTCRLLVTLVLIILSRYVC